MQRLTTRLVAFSAASVLAAACDSRAELQCLSNGDLFNNLACECFASVQCEMLCGEGEMLDPRYECQCAPLDQIVALYPEFTSEDQIRQADGMMWRAREAFDEGNYWRRCPFDPSKHVEECTWGYWDEMACQCLAAFQCYMGCPQEGQLLSPAARCECIDAQDYWAYFPDWIQGNKYDVDVYKRRSSDDFLQYMGARVTKPDTWADCGATDKMCPAGTAFNELACQCFAAIFDEDPCLEVECADGEVRDPRDACSCMAADAFMGLFPAESTPEDVQLSFEVTRYFILENPEMYESLSRADSKLVGVGRVFRSPLMNMLVELAAMAHNQAATATVLGALPLLAAVTTI